MVVQYLVAHFPEILKENLQNLTNIEDAIKISIKNFEKDVTNNFEELFFDNSGSTLTIVCIKDGHILLVMSYIFYINHC